MSEPQVKSLFIQPLENKKAIYSSKKVKKKILLIYDAVDSSGTAITDLVPITINDTRSLTGLTINNYSYEDTTKTDPKHRISTIDIDIEKLNLEFLDIKETASDEEFNKPKFEDITEKELFITKKDRTLLRNIDIDTTKEEEIKKKVNELIETSSNKELEKIKTKTIYAINEIVKKNPNTDATIKIRCFYYTETIKEKSICLSNYYLQSIITDHNNVIGLGETPIKDEDSFTLNLEIRSLISELFINNPKPTPLIKPNLIITFPIKDIKLYLKINLNEDGTINSKKDVNESEILSLYTNEESTAPIFTDYKQIRQFLKYDGYWCDTVKQSIFTEASSTISTKTPVEEVAQAGSPSQPLPLAGAREKAVAEEEEGVNAGQLEEAGQNLPPSTAGIEPAQSPGLVVAGQLEEAGQNLPPPAAGIEPAQSPGLVAAGQLVEGGNKAKTRDNKSNTNNKTKKSNILL